MGNNVVIKHLNSKTGVTYIYWGHSFYSKEKKCTQNSKVSIGKINERGEFEPNKNFLAMSPNEQMSTGLIEKPYIVSRNTKNDSEDIINGVVSRTKFYGWISVLEKVAQEENVTQALKQIFPNSYTTIMNLVESAMTVNSTMYNNRKFHASYWDFARRLISRNEIDEVLKEADSKKSAFFDEFEKTRPESERYSVCAVDSTSYSTYSALLELARYGYNKEHDKLEQLNLLVVCEEETGIPLFYRSVQGNVTDKKVLKATLTQMRDAGFGNTIILVMDRGFWSEENVERLISSNFEFIMCIPSADSLYFNTVKEVHDSLMLTENYIPEIKRSCVQVPYVVEAPRRGTKEPKEMMLYVYYDVESAKDEWNATCSKMVNKLAELKEGYSRWNPKLSSYTGKYFKPVYGKDGNIIDFKHNEETQRDCKNSCGVYVCLGPKEMDPIKVHEHYKHRQRIEDGFGASKERDRRLRASDNSNLEGYIFIDFLVSILDSALRYKMQQMKIDRKYTLDQVEDCISSVRYYVPKGQSFSEGQWIEPTEEQKILLYLMGIEEMEKLYPGVKLKAENECLRWQGLKPKKGRKKKS